MEQLSDELADPAFPLGAWFADAPVAFAIARVDGSRLVVNRVFRELFGSAPQPDYNIFEDPLIAAHGLLPEVRRAFSGDQAVVLALWYDGPARFVGRRVAIELSITPLKDRDGAIRHVALCYKDVTAERELELVRTLFEVAPEAIITCDVAAGTIDDANDNAIRLFGYPRELLIGRALADLSPARQPDGRRSAELAADHVARVMTGQPLELEWMYRTASGEDLPCDVRLVQARAGGRALCRISILDLRQRKREEAERERVRQLEEQNIRIHEANRLKSEFLAAMSHELRTPLTTIIGFSELMFYGRVAPDSPEHHEFIGDILTSSRHLLQLINDVLDLAKVEAGKLEFRPEPIVVESVISEVTGLLRTLSLQKRIRIQVEADRGVEVVVLDPARLRQVLYNYLSNALKFTPEGGRIVVRTSPEAGDSFRLEVEDSGIGIAPEQLHRLFVEFEQLGPGPGAERSQGTGLGLALTRRIVEAQGGTVGVRSSLGHGSVFHAVLPRETPAILIG